MFKGVFFNFGKRNWLKSAFNTTLQYLVDRQRELFHLNCGEKTTSNFFDFEIEKLGLFLIHGIGSHPHVFINYIQNVINAGFYVYGALLPGHFTSPAHLARVRRDAWIDSILDQYDVFSKQVDKVVIIGHSLGAIIALDLATKRKNYGLIVIAAPIIPKAFLLRVAKPIIFLWLPYPPVKK